MDYPVGWSIPLRGETGVKRSCSGFIVYDSSAFVFSRFPHLWVILQHCKRFLWTQTVIELTHYICSTGAVSKVNFLAAHSHHRYSSVAEGSQKHVDNTWVFCRAFLFFTIGTM